MCAGGLLCPNMGARQMYGKLTLQRSTRQPTQKLTRQFHKCACHESSPGHKHGRLVCCRYTTGAAADGLAQRNFSCNLKFLVTHSSGKNQKFVCCEVSCCVAKVTLRTKRPRALATCGAYTSADLGSTYNSHKHKKLFRTQVALSMFL